MKLQCPSCQNVQEIADDSNGQSLRCSKCAAVLATPTAITQTPTPKRRFADDDDDSFSPRHPRPQSAGSGGLSIAVVLIVLAVATFFVLPCVLVVGLGFFGFFLGRHDAMDAEFAMVAQEKAIQAELAEEFHDLRPNVEPRDPVFEKLRALPIEPAVVMQKGTLDDFIAENLNRNDQVGPLGGARPLWAAIGAGVAQDRLRPSPLIRGDWGTVNFRETGPNDGILIGFFASTLNDLRVHYVQPIYLTRGGEKVGNRYGTPEGRVVCVKALRDYAVGAIDVRSGDLCDGFSVTFMRVKDESLDVNDAYRSIHVGGLNGVSGRVGGDGALIVGIHGRSLAEAKGTPAGSITSLGVLSLK